MSLQECVKISPKNIKEMVTEIFQDQNSWRHELHG